MDAYATAIQAVLCYAHARVQSLWANTAHGGVHVRVRLRLSRRKDVLLFTTSSLSPSVYDDTLGLGLPLLSLNTNISTICVCVLMHQGYSLQFDE